MSGGLHIGWLPAHTNLVCWLYGMSEGCCQHTTLTNHNILVTTYPEVSYYFNLLKHRNTYKKSMPLTYLPLLVLLHILIWQCMSPMHAPVGCQNLSQITVGSKYVVSSLQAPIVAPMVCFYKHCMVLATANTPSCQFVVIEVVYPV